MRRLAALLGAVALAAASASPILAAPKLSCSVEPVSASAGSEFIVSIVGASGNLGTEIGWKVWQPSTNTYWFSDYVEEDVPASGKFSEEQVVPLSGIGSVAVYSYSWSSYTTAYCSFTSTD